ncbi:MAG: hypothetical protein NUW37_12975 [Planctomycetes bacterium]|nr:hypothetical protein [Planctomycetota bacterium]
MTKVIHSGEKDAGAVPDLRVRIDEDAAEFIKLRGFEDGVEFLKREIPKRFGEEGFDVSLSYPLEEMDEPRLSIRVYSSEMDQIQFLDRADELQEELEKKFSDLCFSSAIYRKSARVT